MNEHLEYLFKGIWFGAGVSLIVALPIFAGPIVADFIDGEVLTAEKLNGLVNGLASVKEPPVGAIIAWHGSDENTPELPDGWVPCNGQTLNDAESPYDGQVIANLNGDASGAASPGFANAERLFLRGGTTSGQTEVDQFQGHYHASVSQASAFLNIPADPGLFAPFSGGTLIGANVQVGHPTNGGYGTARYGYETRPVNYSVIWIMRVK